MREELSHYCKPPSRADALQHPQSLRLQPIEFSDPATYAS